MGFLFIAGDRDERVGGRVFVAGVSATVNIPAPANAPTAAEHHSVAAVFRPRTLSPSRMINPAPRNPIPDTICAATRVGSAVAQLNPYADNNTNKVAPTATKALVRNPAIRARYWRPNPMTGPRPIPATRRAGSPARARP